MKFASKKQELEHEEKYIEFLKKRLDSANFKANVSDDEYAKTKQKYEKAKFRVKLLKMAK